MDGWLGSILKLSHFHFKPIHSTLDLWSYFYSTSKNDQPIHPLLQFLISILYSLHTLSLSLLTPSMTLYINPKLVSSVGFDGSSSIHPSIKNSSSPTYSPISSLISHLSRLPLPIPHPSSSILNPSQCGLCSGWGRWVSGLGGEKSTQKLISQRLCQTLSEAEPVLADDGWSKGCTVMNPIKFPLTPCALSSTTAQSSPRSGEELIWWVGWPMKILISLSSVFGPRHRFRVLLASQVTKLSWSMTSWHTSISSRHQVGGESLVGVRALEFLLLLLLYEQENSLVIWIWLSSIDRSIDRDPNPSTHQALHRINPKQSAPEAWKTIIRSAVKRWWWSHPSRPPVADRRSMSLSSTTLCSSILPSESSTAWELDDLDR